jgi:hypothetical protein
MEELLVGYPKRLVYSPVSSTYVNSSIDKKLRPTIPFNGVPNLEERSITPVSLFIGKAFVLSLLKIDKIDSTVDFTVSFISLVAAWIRDEFS